MDKPKTILAKLKPSTEPINDIIDGRTVRINPSEDFTGYSEAVIAKHGKSFDLKPKTTPKPEPKGKE